MNVTLPTQTCRPKNKRCWLCILLRLLSTLDEMSTKRIPDLCKLRHKILLTIFITRNNVKVQKIVIDGIFFRVRLSFLRILELLFTSKSRRNYWSLK